MSEPLTLQKPRTETVGAPARVSGCRDSVSLFERITLLILITLGIESVLYFMTWWLQPQHRKSGILFYILTFAVGWGLFRSLVNWFYFFFIRGSRHKKAPEGLKADVFTTAMPGEPYEMFEKTLAAISKISYPHESYLLDGGNDPRLRELCSRLGVHHLDCRNIEGAKAGKVNYALSKSKGDFVLIIDPDHIPEPDFFDQVLGHFEDPQVGFVQVVQGYYNQSESIVARASAEQTYGFYGPTMMGMNGLGTPVAIGANCTFRRKALESIDGHAVHLAEDLVTSLRLHAQGWKSVYVPHRMSFGLVPADLASYFKQQLKWSTGMFQAFSGEYLPRFFKLPLVRKLHYLFSGTFYLEGLATAITCILPILFLFFGLWAVEMEFIEFLIHVTPYVSISFLIGWYVQRFYRNKSEKGFLWRGMVLNKGTWAIYVLGFLFWLSRTKVPYLPTPKKSERGVFTGLVMPHIVVIVLSLAAIVYSLLTYARMEEGVWVMIFFASLNIVTMLPTVIIAHADLFRRNVSK
ncbi:MAG: glycosyltransferase [Chitinispirillaceae bacterium]